LLIKKPPENKKCPLPERAYFVKTPHLPDKPQDLAPCLITVRLPGFTGPVSSAALDKVVFILYITCGILSIGAGK